MQKGDAQEMDSIQTWYSIGLPISSLADFRGFGVDSPFLLLSNLIPITPNAANDMDSFPADDRVYFYFPT